MRCVNETRLPASLSCLRRPSIVVTAIVRNEVAVGIDRLSSMYRASMPAPPRSGWGSAAGAGAGDVRDVDPLGGGDAGGDGRDLGVGRDRLGRDRRGAGAVAVAGGG